MLERKFAQYLEQFLSNEPNKILLVNGARQIGKSYLVRYIGKRLFKHFVEILTLHSHSLLHFTIHSLSFSLNH